MDDVIEAPEKGELPPKTPKRKNKMKSMVRRASSSALLTRGSDDRSKLSLPVKSEFKTTKRHSLYVKSDRNKLEVADAEKVKTSPSRRGSFLGLRKSPDKRKVKTPIKTPETIPETIGVDEVDYSVSVKELTVTPRVKRKEVPIQPKLMEIEYGKADLDSAEYGHDIIIQEIESGHFLGPALRAVYEGNDHEKFLDRLESRIRQHDRDIERMCNFHYQGFIESITELINVRGDTEKLKTQSLVINKELQESGRDVCRKRDDLVQAQLQQLNVCSAIEKLTLCLPVLQMYAKMTEQMKAGRYYSALKTLEQLEHTYLPRVYAYRFCEVMLASIPRVRDEIKEVSMAELKGFLESVRNNSDRIGRVAMKQVEKERRFALSDDITCLIEDKASDVEDKEDKEESPSEADLAARKMVEKKMLEERKKMEQKMAEKRKMAEKKSVSNKLRDSSVSPQHRQRLNPFDLSDEEEEIVEPRNPFDDDRNNPFFEDKAPAPSNPFEDKLTNGENPFLEKNPFLEAEEESKDVEDEELNPFVTDSAKSQSGSRVVANEGSNPFAEDNLENESSNPFAADAAENEGSNPFAANDDVTNPKNDSSNPKVTNDDVTNPQNDSSNPFVTNATPTENKEVPIKAPPRRKKKKKGGKSADSQNKSADSQNKSADSQNKNADSQNKSADSQNKSADSQTKNADPQNKNADSQTKNAESQIKSVGPAIQVQLIEDKQDMEPPVALDSRSNEKLTSDPRTNNSNSNLPPNNLTPSTFDPDPNHLTPVTSDPASFHLKRASLVEEMITPKWKATKSWQMPRIYYDLSASDLVDFSPVYKCLHIFTLVGSRATFEGYYRSQRRNQARLVLQPPPSMHTRPEAYSHYFYQIVGFFVVEDHVLHTAQNLTSRNFIDDLWEMGISKLVTVLRTDSGYSDDAKLMMKVKNLVVTFADTMKAYGFQVGRLFSLLMEMRDQYGEILLKYWASKFEGIFDEDNYTPILVETEGGARDALRMFPYQDLKFEESGFPKKLPFSRFVPRIFNEIKQFILSCLKYCEDLHLSSTEVDDMLRKSANLLLTRTLSSGLDSLVQKPALGLTELVQIIVNTSHLENSCRHVEDFVCDITGVRAGSAHAAKLVGVSTFKDARNKTEAQIYSKLNSKVDEFFELAEYRWDVREPLGRASRYLTDLIAFLRHNFKVFTNLPSSVAQTACMSACQHISSNLMQMIMDRDVKVVTMAALQQFNLDVMQCELFSDSEPVPGFEDGTLQLSFVELRQLLDLFLAWDWSAYLADYGSENSKYLRVSPSTALHLLEKIKEERGHRNIFTSLSKQEREKKKLLETVVRQLRGIVNAA